MAHTWISAKSFAKKYKQRTEALFELSRKLTGQVSPEDIHDLRVTTRRLQTLRKILPNAIRESASSRRLDSTLKALLKSTSRIRDLDSLRATFKGEKVSLPTDLQLFMEESRKTAMTRAMASIKTFSKAPIQLFDAGIGDKKLSRRLERRIEKRVPVINSLLSRALRDEQKVEELHSLRLEVKKLRYLLEMVDKKPRELVMLTRWQESLGRIHDLDVATGYLRDHLPTASMEGTLGRLKRVRHSCFQQFVAQWRKDSTLIRSGILKPKPRTTEASG